jgi:outer membrane receptor protein involved in Fe transport
MRAIAFMKKILPLFFLFSSLFTHAQGIKGRVLDGDSKRPLGYVTIAASRMNDKAYADGASADSSGNFQLNHLAAGRYRLTIEFIGYQTRIIDSVQVGNSVVNMGVIRLQPEEKSLNEVTVVGHGPVVENKIDRIVYNTDNDITSQSGTALDVLKKTPMVSVDIGGNVELQGSSSVRFLINGKPSTAFGNSVTDVLAGLPASRIKSIEVISNPGAQYDAQGTGGIINIILKENKIQGYNGSVNLSAGTRLENGSFNLNVTQGKLSFNAYASGNDQLASRTPFSQQVSTYDTGALINTQRNQNGYFDLQRHGYQSGAGIDYDFNKKTSLSAGVSYFGFGFSNGGQSTQHTMAKDSANEILSDNSLTRTYQTGMNSGTLEGHLNFHHDFSKEGSKLDAFYSVSDNHLLNTYNQSQTNTGDAAPFTGTQSNDPGSNLEQIFSADISHPVNKSFTLQAGIKTDMESIRSQAQTSVLNPVSGTYTNDPREGFDFQYNRAIYAAYVSGRYSAGKFLDVLAGLRAEYAVTRINDPEYHIPDNLLLSPSLILSHPLSGSSSIKLSYSRRLERPEYYNVNPFFNLSDPYNVTTGNPMLQPELGNNMELGYNRNFKKGGSVYVAFTERINTQDIKPITLFYESYAAPDTTYRNISVTTRQNAGEEYNTGINISASKPLMRGMNLRGNVEAGQRYMVSPLLDNKPVTGYRVRVNMNLSYQFSHNVAVEAFGNYSSPSRILQGRIPQMLTYTIAGRWEFDHQKASLGLTATNLFSPYIRQISTVSSPGYSSYYLKETPYRSVGLSFSYKFGKGEVIKKKKMGDDNFQNSLPGNE